MLKDIKLGSKTIGDGRRPFYIAELSGNHNNSLKRALELVDAAVEAGADAVKIQTYTPDTMTLNIDSGDFVISDDNSPWNGRSLYELYQEAMTPWDWHEPIFDRCRLQGIECFSTPFDESAVDFLETLGCPIYKIASFENNHIPLIQKVALLGKPMIISSGMASAVDLFEAVGAVRECGLEDLVVLKCTSAYPAKAKDANISTIPHMKSLLKVHTGLSDHTLGVGVAIAATCLGATVIEKHFTLSRAEGGVDSSFSLEPHEFKMLVDECNAAFDSIGEVQYGKNASEEKISRFRRSIYVSKAIKKGEVFSTENTKCVRPGFGLAPKFYPSILGKVSSRDLSVGTPMNAAYVEDCGTEFFT